MDDVTNTRSRQRPHIIGSFLPSPHTAILGNVGPPPSSVCWEGKWSTRIHIVSIDDCGQLRGCPLECVEIDGLTTVALGICVLPHPRHGPAVGDRPIRVTVATIGTGH